MIRKEHILLVANWESNVGYAWWLMENFWATIANHLESKGVGSVLIYPKITKVPESIATTNINVTEHNFQDITPSNLNKLHNIIKTYNIKYIYLTDKPTYSWLYLLLRFWGIKKIIIHDHTPGERAPTSGLKRIIKSTIQRIPFFTADHLIAVTEFVYQRFLNVACIPAEKCHCAPNGIQPIDLQTSDINYAQKLFDIPKDKTIVITTGRATLYKGIDFFIECANEIINNQKNKLFHFLYCGDGPEITTFKNMVKKYELENNFFFLGRRDDVRKILPSCDIGFHSAIGEVGYSLSILEYMSAGLVSIVPDNPSTSLATKHGVNGYKYTPKNLRSAAKMIIKSTDKKHASRLRKEAINDVNTKYNIENTNKSICRIMNQIIS